MNNLRLADKISGKIAKVLVPTIEVGDVVMLDLVFKTHDDPEEFYDENKTSDLVYCALNHPNSVDEQSNNYLLEPFACTEHNQLYVNDDSIIIDYDSAYAEVVREAENQEFDGGEGVTITQCLENAFETEDLMFEHFRIKKYGTAPYLVINV